MLFFLFWRGETHHPITFRATQRTVIKSLLNPCMKEHFPAASLQAWRGWVGRGDAGIPPWASLGPFQLSMPSRTCPVDNSKHIFTGQPLQGCREGSGAGQYSALCSLPAQHWLPLPSTGMAQNASGAEPGALQGLELPLLHGKDSYWHPNISIYGQDCISAFLHQPWS